MTKRKKEFVGRELTPSSEVGKERVWPEDSLNVEPVGANFKPRPTNMRGAFEYVRLAGREEAAQIADLVARRRALAGDEAGAGAARDIARLIRHDEGLGKG